MSVLSDGRSVPDILQPPPRLRPVTLDAPWAWLRHGWADMWRIPRISLAYGLAFTAISLTLVTALFVIDMSAVALAMAAGFMLVGPMLAVGMYEASRRLEAGIPIRLRDVVFVSARSPGQLAFLGAILTAVLLVWMRLATLLFALFFGNAGFPPLDEFVPTLLLTWHGLGLLIVGTGAGGILAFATFAISAISVPMLLVSDRDAVTAVLASIEAVKRNVWPMLLWGWLVALLTAFGIATLFIGMAITFPLLGHATWHAYRALVVEEN